MDTAAIICELEAARDRLSTAIAALQGGRGGRGLARSTNGGRRYLSASVRRRISEGMKKRWAARKKAE